MEIKGPPSIDVWIESYMVMRTGLISFGALSLGRLEEYSDKIVHYSNRYGPEVWALLYQADVRARSELWERKRREAERDKEKAERAGKHHGLDPAKPWDFSLHAVTMDAEWWRKHVEEPAILVIAKVKSLATVMAQDHNANGLQPPPRNPTRHAEEWGASDYQQPPAKKARGAFKQHNVHNGVYSTNRGNVPLCEGWNDGSCTQTGRQNRCGRDWYKAHQCSGCLSSDHGLSAPCPFKGKQPKAPAQPPATYRREKGKSKGGKKGGKQW